MQSTSLSWGSIPNLVQAFATLISAMLAIIALIRQQSQAKKMKVLESDLDKSKFEHQTTFVKLHEKRAEVTSEIYRRVVVLEIWITHVVCETALPDEAFTSPEDFAENFDTIFGHISLNLQDLAA